ncbi:helix-turn-helix transcriptional regulator [Cohnella nanjingensis]|uniref:YafY family transcriptional regulator n=1 Tax=Cohnella nanjingensis TaxID=1387779 RepID=A0A7X0RQV9_9BACL|nr:YafY family protein [Cohnella nanjingensis]MBB6672044.1 YafY family transcriptional regulator [Cohnella nanjingensis]
MKLDRLLSITMTLMNQPRVSATELAERFEVSLRTIYRDMDAINQAGIPIVSFPGSDGGYEIMSSFRIDRQVLSLDDFSAIYSALRGARSATESLNIDKLLEKIGALMPQQAGVADAANLDLDFQPTPNDKEKIGPLHEAIKQLRLVRFEYLDTKGAESERSVEPMGLFLKGYVWYLYGYCLARSDIRIFRLTRMLRLKTLSETFERRDFTLQDVERQFMSRADFAKVKAKLCFSPEAKTRVRDEFGFDRITDHPDGTLSVAAGYSSLERAVQKILSYGSQVTVLDPPELIEELKRHVRQMAVHYGIA